MTPPVTAFKKSTRGQSHPPGAFLGIRSAQRPVRRQGGGVGTSDVVEVLDRAGRTSRTLTNFPNCSSNRRSAESGPWSWNPQTRTGSCWQTPLGSGDGGGECSPTPVRSGFQRRRTWPWRSGWALGSRPGWRGPGAASPGYHQACTGDTPTRRIERYLRSYGLTYISDVFLVDGRSGSPSSTRGTGWPLSPPGWFLG